MCISFLFSIIILFLCFNLLYIFTFFWGGLGMSLEFDFSDIDYSLQLLSKHADEYYYWFKFLYLTKDTADIDVS